MDAINLGIDLGRSETRLYDGQQLYMIPTLIGGPVSAVRRSGAQAENEAVEQQLSIKLGRHEYTVGRHAMEQPFFFPVNDLDLFEDDLNLALMLSVIGLYVRRLAVTGTPKLKICLGLPVALCRRKAYTEQHLAEWTRLHAFEFCGDPMSVDIVQIDYIPQPVGAVYSSIFDGQLEYSPTENIGVIDPGHLSTDWIVVRLPNELSAFSGHTTASAGFRLTDVLSNHLTEQGVVRLDPLAILESLSTQEYRDNGRTIALGDELTADLLERMAQAIALTVKQAWRDISIDRMLLVGGLGRLLYPFLTQYAYFRDLQLLTDFRYGNVRGAYEYAIASPFRGSEPAAPAKVAKVAKAGKEAQAEAEASVVDHGLKESSRKAPVAPLPAEEPAEVED